MLVRAILYLLILVVPALSAAAELYEVQRVVDGDTVVLARVGRARLIGVDTPETKHPAKPVQFFGREASSFTSKLLSGKRVRVEYDVQRRDRYGRALVYLYLEDGTFVNAELIKQGYAHAYTRFPFKYLDEFRGYEREAREKRVGLWADSAVNAHQPKSGAAKSAPIDVPVFVNDGAFACVKKTCGQISSCEEAKFLLRSCGFRRLDGDGDGVPCEKLCR